MSAMKGHCSGNRYHPPNGKQREKLDRNLGEVRVCVEGVVKHLHKGDWKGDEQECRVTREEKADEEQARDWEAKQSSF